MHNAPSVTYPVGRSRFVGYLVFVAAGCGLAMIALGALQAQTPPWVAGFGLVSALAAGCWAGLRWWRTPVGDLCWNGQGWIWSVDVASNGPAGPRGILICIDLQMAVLVRQPLGGGHSIWLWLERSRAPHRWSALRRAVYSPATHAATAGALPVPKTP